MKLFSILFISLLCAQLSFSQTFTLKSADLGGQFTNQFTASSFGCNGNNKSPQLSWANAPEGTKSFAITMYDPDAPTGSGFWHWVMVNIPSSIHELKQGAGDVKSNVAPAGSLQSMNDTGAPGYQGPCPPAGDSPHHYLITIYALKTENLGTTATSTAALTGFMLGQQALAKASIVVYAKR
ncbi:YbhB/YbcL family Raf kinase inhibitor-like protein [Mucilaginibacter sp. HMF5004]|uniref:YbhB/YbcL family Raf kinase inhibitor-like protein n=1 Tax=Mucilaginibacter rivuli TaxID=2857527 RepID=UPI001C60169D|nr:YbhB/YbcL family Raf kinase inhibitor-like protein [Mucilaginibacter rivuli]MBW4888831.1 YbhB/YbcL family Raf kinase inhibitor-like protein [Mucilaginibacter rivuli]